MVRRRVGYFYESEIGNFHLGRGHPMKPHRVRLTHELVVAYQLDRKLQPLPQGRLISSELTKFHTDEYVAFLKKVNPNNCFDEELAEDLKRFNVGGYDCPVFDCLFSYVQIYTGGSIAAAVSLNRADAAVAINWAGGMHHARKAQAGGNCYANDAVLAILELLRYHARVLYVDIDYTHGDGVEEAFYSSNRVMTLSLHKHGADTFPGSGAAGDIGEGEGKGYSINLPLKDGIRDAPYLSLFEGVVGAAARRFNPSVIVMQCGANSLAGDRIGSFNLTHVGHCGAVEFVCSLDTPLLLLGGGGCSLSNVARVWARETMIALGGDDAALSTPTLPRSAANTTCYEYFSPDYSLDVEPVVMRDENMEPYLESVEAAALATLRDYVEVVPGGGDHKRSAGAAGLSDAR